MTSRIPPEIRTSIEEDWGSDLLRISYLGRWKDQQVFTPRFVEKMHIGFPQLYFHWDGKFCKKNDNSTLRIIEEIERAPRAPKALVQELRKEYGKSYTRSVYVGQWRGYQVFEPHFSERMITGKLLVYLVKNGKYCTPQNWPLGFEYPEDFVKWEK